LDLKPGVIKELARASNHDETTMGVLRRGIIFQRRHGTGGRIEPVLPDQFVGERKDVPFKIKLSCWRGGR
jgi:hypothetical protein